MVTRDKAHMGSGANHGAGDLVRRVVVHLRVHFKGTLSDEDHEDLAQSAYCELLAKRRRGERIEAPLALLKRIAWRDAQDLLRARREVPTDPSATTLGSLADSRLSPEERLLKRAELARALAALTRLDALQAAAYRASVLDGLCAEEACSRIGRRPSVFFGYLRAARSALEATRSAEHFAPIERALLDAYVAGLGSAAERRGARQLIDADPHAAALARRLVRQTRGRRRHRPVARIVDGPADDREPGEETTGGDRCSRSLAHS
jgi:DNA-directed RNA polymerase specialized sigma24 family protein